MKDVLKVARKKMDKELTNEGERIIETARLLDEEDIKISYPNGLPSEEEF